MSSTFTSFQDFKRRYPIRPNDKDTLLGSGSYGRVIKVEDQLETEWVAIKISEFKGNDPKSLKAEVELAQRIPRQANIARYDACYRLETDTSVSDFAIMKYYPDGNLADLLRRVTLNPGQIYDITKGILLGLQHLHRHRIVHRDFKPANILISRDNAGRFIPKIADFGLSKLVSDDELDSSDFDLSDGRGTPSYKAPEQIEGSRVSFNLDLWAFGVILFEMLTGEKPFQADLRNSSEQSARREIEKKIITVELPARLHQIEEPYKAMIQRCLVRDIHERVRKEDELLDLLDTIPQLVSEAEERFSQKDYPKALLLFEQVLLKREHHTVALQGMERCKLEINKLQLTNLLNEASLLANQQQFEQAKSYYEQVLRLAPDNQAAAIGLASCIDQLRPKPSVVHESEFTDVYQEEKTDVYVTPPVLSSPAAVVHKPFVPVDADNEKKAWDNNLVVTKAISKDVMGQQPFAPRTEKPFPWHIAAPVIIGLSIGGYFLYPNSSGTKTTEKTVSQASIASIKPQIKVPNEQGPKVETESLPGNSDAENAVNKRVDVAFNTARQAFREKDFNKVVTFTASALQLDPTRQDIARLHNIALHEIAKSGDGTRKETGKPVAPETTPEATKPAPVETVKEPEKKENAVNAKQLAQEEYDQLIEAGRMAIAKGNNKAKAIADFTSARALANKHDLNTAKADEAYNTYIAKGNKIFDSEEYEGAKEWYKVAQALKETQEVQRKIKQCNNQ